jgi:hypothetical protein
VVSDIQKKSNLLYDSKGQVVQNNIDPNILHQINEGVKNFKFEMTNALNRVIEIFFILLY